MNPALRAAEFLMLGGLLGADQAAGPQWMMGQPLVAGTLAGALVGDAFLGGIVGLWCQLTWNGAVPVGSRPHPDVSGGTLAGVLAASSLAASAGAQRAAMVGILTALVVGWLGVYVVFLNRRWNARWTRWVAEIPQEAGRLRRVRLAQRLAWLVTASISGAWVLAGAGAGILAAPLVLRFVPSGVTVSGPGPMAWLWGLGLAGALLAFVRSPRTDWTWLLAGGLAAAGLRIAGGR